MIASTLILLPPFEDMAQDPRYSYTQDDRFAAYRGRLLVWLSLKFVSRAWWLAIRSALLPELRLGTQFWNLTERFPRRVEPAVWSNKVRSIFRWTTPVVLDMLRLTVDDEVDAVMAEAAGRMGGLVSLLISLPKDRGFNFAWSLLVPGARSMTELCVEGCLWGDVLPTWEPPTESTVVGSLARLCLGRVDVDFAALRRDVPDIKWLSLRGCSLTDSGDGISDTPTFGSLADLTVLAVPGQRPMAGAISSPFPSVSRLKLNVIDPGLLPAQGPSMFPSLVRLDLFSVMGSVREVDLVALLTRHAFDTLRHLSAPHSSLTGAAKLWRALGDHLCPRLRSLEIHLRSEQLHSMVRSLRSRASSATVDRLEGLHAYNLAHYLPGYGRGSWPSLPPADLAWMKSSMEVKGEDPHPAR